MTCKFRSTGESMKQSSLGHSSAH
uniref:Uncharacterized protein n=1 Tax=Anguilla anguilla TaxID=7936 RepID=A0A0E9VWG3_ANGAN